MTQIKATVRPRGGGAKYSVDLSEFSAGGSGDAIVRGSWGGDFSGRPAFAREIAEMLEEHAPTENSYAQMKTGLRAFFRYLDWKERRSRGPRAESCAEVTDAMGIELRQWLGSNKGAYRNIKTALNAMRSNRGLRPLFWPNRRPDTESFREPPSQEGMRRLYHALKHEGRQIKAMFAEGERLASAGSDPRENGGWDLAQNRAFLVRSLLESGVPDRARLDREGSSRLLKGGACPGYLAPTMDERFANGMSGAVRWFVPGRAETAVFFWLFMLGTGWNPSTACGVDVLDPDGWSRPHPQSDLFAVIHAWKARADRHQFTISMVQPEWHPYRILEFIIGRTEILRRQVLQTLAAAVVEPRPTPGSTWSVRSPISNGFRVLHGCSPPATWEPFRGFVGNNDSFLLDTARAVVTQNGLDTAEWRLGGVVAKDARLAWIGHAYVHSGYHQLLTKLAGNHGSLRTTRHYIRSMRYRAYSEDQIRKLQDALFAEIGSGRVVDPTRLRLLVENGSITPDQERRLADHRQRTSVGMGCLDPVAPPKQVAPDHRDGALCRVQRCTGCPHGIVFPDSVSPLARRLAELMHLRRAMPMAAWDGSSLADEQDSVGQTLAYFDAGLVEAEVAGWMKKLEEGEIAVHGTYPSY
jgi:hypothetical protein